MIIGWLKICIICYFILYALGLTCDVVAKIYTNLGLKESGFATHIKCQRHWGPTPTIFFLNLLPLLTYKYAAKIHFWIIFNQSKTSCIENFLGTGCWSPSRASLLLDIHSSCHQHAFWVKLGWDRSRLRGNQQTMSCLRMGISGLTLT